MARCPQCASSYVNGVFCHEHGCPNKAWKPKRRKAKGTTKKKAKPPERRVLIASSPPLTVPESAIKDEKIVIEAFYDPPGEALYDPPDAGVPPEPATAGPPPSPPKLEDWVRTNFETLRRAFHNGDVALVSAIRKSDNKPFALISIMEFVDGVFRVTPIAAMLDCDPFETFYDPTKSGGST